MRMRCTLAVCAGTAGALASALACGSNTRPEVQSAVIGAPNAPTPGWGPTSGSTSPPPTIEGDGRLELQIRRTYGGSYNGKR